MPSPAITITDPRTAPTYPDGPFSRWCRRALYEERDEVFIRLTLRAVITQALAMVALYAALRYTHIPAAIPILLYFALWGWAAPPIILMLHCTMHRRFIRSPRWLDKAHPFIMSFFFGMPMGFREHHIGMHHVEDNVAEDLSATLRYRRDSFAHFLVYFARFFFLIAIELPLYLFRKNRNRMARRAIIGELAQWTIIVSSMVFIDLRFGFAAFLLPCVASRFAMMAGNWGQHAFLNTARKNDGMSNAITCINCGYNARCFNDGYHVGHHVRANRHWTELPADFVENRELYAREGVIVFERLDFFQVSLLLWIKRWDVLARRYVRLDGPRSDADVIAMLKARVQPVESWPAEQIG